jgi:hypothetical protein
MIGRVVLIRTYSAGVHYGTLVSWQEKVVRLVDARRIWMWKGAFTLSEVSQLGVQADSRIAMKVPEIILTEAIEIIPISPEALQSLDNCHE